MSEESKQTAPPSNHSPRSGYIIALVSSFGAGAGTVIGKWNLESISPLLMNATVFSIGTLMLSAWIFPRNGFKNAFRLSRRGWFWLAMFSLSSWVAVMTYWSGVQKMDPTLASFLNRSQVLVAIFLGIFFLRERFRTIETVGAILSITGIVIMRLTLRGEYSAGFWLVLVGSLFFGITEFVSKIAVRHVEPSILTYLRNALLAVSYWVVFFTTDLTFDGLDQVWIGVIGLGFFGPILSRMLYVMALQRLDLSKTAVISQSQPIWVILIALFFLNQLPTIREVVGGVFLLFGCVLMIAGQWRPALLTVTKTLPTAFLSQKWDSLSRTFSGKGR